MKKTFYTFFEDDGTLLGNIIEAKIANFVNRNHLSPSDYKICDVITHQMEKDGVVVPIREASILYYAVRELA